jgi:hypothetical protein
MAKSKAATKAVHGRRGKKKVAAKGSKAKKAGRKKHATKNATNCTTTDWNRGSTPFSQAEYNEYDSRFASGRCHRAIIVGNRRFDGIRSGLRRPWTAKLKDEV